MLMPEGVDLRIKVGSLIENVMHKCSLGFYESPYYTKGLSKGRQLEQKGKLDDVSVIVAEVVLC